MICEARLHGNTCAETTTVSIGIIDVIHGDFCETTDSMQYRPPNANQEVSNTNHLGSLLTLEYITQVLYYLVKSQNLLCNCRQYHRIHVQHLMAVIGTAASPNRMKNVPAMTGSGMVTNSAPNLVNTPKTIMNPAESSTTCRLPTYNTFTITDRA